MVFSWWSVSSLHCIKTHAAAALFFVCLFFILTTSIIVKPTMLTLHTHLFPVHTGEFQMPVPLLYVGKGCLTRAFRNQKSSCFPRFLFAFFWLWLLTFRFGKLNTLLAHVTWTLHYENAKRQMYKRCHNVHCDAGSNVCE